VAFLPGQEVGSVIVALVYMNLKLMCPFNVVNLLADG
jgi:hypothetical protein